MSDLLNLSKKENFIPVVDDRDMFIGIITRQDIIDYFYKNNLGDIYE
jgi:CBS domain-containing protein